jgi:hypothetical protein
MEQAEHKKVQPIWVPYIRKSRGMKSPIRWQRKDLNNHSTEPKTAFNTSERAAKWAITDWMNRKHQELLMSTPGH